MKRQETRDHNEVKEKVKRGEKGPEGCKMMVSDSSQSIQRMTMSQMQIKVNVTGLQVPQDWVLALLSSGC